MTVQRSVCREKKSNESCVKYQNLIFDIGPGRLVSALHGSYRNSREMIWSRNQELTSEGCKTYEWWAAW